MASKPESRGIYIWVPVVNRMISDDYEGNELKESVTRLQNLLKDRHFSFTPQPTGAAGIHNDLSDMFFGDTIVYLKDFASKVNIAIIIIHKRLTYLALQALSDIQILRSKFQGSEDANTQEYVPPFGLVFVEINDACNGEVNGQAEELHLVLNKLRAKIPQKNRSVISTNVDDPTLFGRLHSEVIVLSTRIQPSRSKAKANYLIREILQ